MARVDERRWRPTIAALLGTAPERRERALRAMAPPALRGLIEEWGWNAYRGQLAPEGEWRVWLLIAGRGFGKTRAGSEWVLERIREAEEAGAEPPSIALVGANLGEVERVMVAGPSGLVATAGTGERPLWQAGRRRLLFPGGAQALAYSAERPESLRGPQHHFAWCDELAKWRCGDATWDNLMFGLRAGERPRTLVTTTPRAVPLLRRIRGLEGAVRTHGRSRDNVATAAAALAAMEADYGGTRRGREELDGEWIEDVEGALWPWSLIEASRGEAPELVRVVVGVDPPASADGVCGISVCGEGSDGRLYVLADASAGGLRPDGWAQAVARAAESWGADRVVAEANNGGDMVESVLRNVAPALPVRLVHASRGKVARAEPIAALFDRGIALFAGRFAELEEELAGMTQGGGFTGRSPDRADAMVWALTELSPQPRAEPRIRAL